MNIFSKPIAAVTIDDVTEFCQLGLPENVRVEYKRELSGKDAAKQVGKEVSALANTQGGIILFGVAEDEQRRPIIPFEGIAPELKPAQKITSICLSNIYPPVVPEIQECPVGSNGKVVVVVRVPESDQTPHSLNGKTEWYVRANDLSQPRSATEAELEWLQNRRQKTLEQKTRLLTRASERFQLIRRDNASPYFVCRCTPIFPASPLLSLEQLSGIGKSARGTYIPPLGMGEQHPANDSVISLPRGSRRSDAGSPLKEFWYGQLDTDGLSYFASSIPYEVYEGTQAINQYRMINPLYRFLKWTGDMYREAGYFGLVDFEFGAYEILRRRLMFDMGGFREAEGPECIDKEFRLRRILPVDSLAPSGNPSEGLNGVLMDVLRELRWTFGYDEAALNQETLLKVIAKYNKG